MKGLALPVEKNLNRNVEKKNPIFLADNHKKFQTIRSSR